MAVRRALGCVCEGGRLRCYSSRTSGGDVGRVSSTLDRLADALADAATDQATRAPPVYSFRRPLGTIGEAHRRLYNTPCPSRPYLIPEVIYLTEKDQVDRILPAALQHAGTVAGAIGFDLEWNITAKPRTAAVMQLGIADRIYLLHLSNMKQIPESVRDMLADPALLKVGVAIRNDGHKLRRDFGVPTNGLVELSTMAKLLEPQRWKHRRLLVSLRDLCQAYLARTLRKDAVRVGTWTNVPLTHTQKEYAASDAYVGLELFHRLLAVAHDRACRRAKQVAETYPAVTPLQATLSIVRQATGHVESI